MKNQPNNLTPQQRLAEALRLYHSAKELKRAALKKFHPQLTENEIKEKVKKIFTDARS
jgi:hypothetical protein